MNTNYKKRTFDKSPIGESEGRLKASVFSTLSQSERSRLDKETHADDKTLRNKTLSWAKENPIKSALAAGVAVYFIGPKKVLKLARLSITAGLLTSAMSALNTLTSDSYKK